MQLFAAVLIVYFFVSAGAVYDMINAPPSIGRYCADDGEYKWTRNSPPRAGYVRDEKGNVRPMAIMPYRINGQYIVEGLAASFMFTLGGVF